MRLVWDKINQYEYLFIMDGIEYVIVETGHGLTRQYTLFKDNFLIDSKKTKEELEDFIL